VAARVCDCPALPAPVSSLSGASANEREKKMNEAQIEMAIDALRPSLVARLLKQEPRGCPAFLPALTQDVETGETRTDFYCLAKPIKGQDYCDCIPHKGSMFTSTCWLRHWPDLDNLPGNPLLINENAQEYEMEVRALDKEQNGKEENKKEI